MGINQKDIKILWAKAAGRCSICNLELNVESGSSPSGITLIGENCHIVGDKLKSGPRHKSNLSEEDRDRYPNLILLCSNHHTEIDGDETKYTIEILHQIKADHEIFVQTALTRNQETLNKKLYSHLLNAIVEKLDLSHWGFQTDVYVRLLMWSEQINNMNALVIQLKKVSWPREEIALEEALQDVGKWVKKYISHYTSISCPRDDGNSWYEDKMRYNDVLNRLPYLDSSEKKEKDYKIHFNNLFNLTVSLNKLAKIVRVLLNPEFFLLQGNFLISDELGVTENLVSAVYFPDEYISVGLGRLINIEMICIRVH